MAPVPALSRFVIKTDHHLLRYPDTQTTQETDALDEKAKYVGLRDCVFASSMPLPMQYPGSASHRQLSSLQGAKKI
jgi:hypothetical protein